MVQVAVPETRRGRYAFHIANEGIRVGRQGGRAKREGIVRGVADICLAIPNHGYGALYIEMKRPKTFDHKATYQTPDQKHGKQRVRNTGTSM